MTDENPLDTITTADLIAELFKRFDAAVVVTFELRTEDDSETAFWRKGDVMRAIGMHEAAKVRLVKGSKSAPGPGE